MERRILREQLKWEIVSSALEDSWVCFVTIIHRTLYPANLADLQTAKLRHRVRFHNLVAVLLERDMSN